MPAPRSSNTAADRLRPPPRTRIASGISRVVRMSGRPEAGGELDARAAGHRHAQHGRVLDRRDLLDPHARRRGSAALPAGTWSGISPAVPIDFARQDDEPLVQGGVVDGDRRPGPRGPRTAPPRADRRSICQADRAGAGGAGAGRRAAAGARPGSPPRSRAGRRPARNGVSARAPAAIASATLTRGVAARRRPTRYRGPNDRSTTIAAARASAPAAMRHEGGHGRGF